jgi:hypothetical protein
MYLVKISAWKSDISTTVLRDVPPSFRKNPGTIPQIKPSPHPLIFYSLFSNYHIIRFRFPVRSLDFSIDLTLPAALRPWGQISL